jgi:hypothetical protein
MMNMFRRMPLIARVSVALIAAAVLPLGYAVRSLFDVNRAGMYEQVLRTHAVAASTAAERIAGAVEATCSGPDRSFAGSRDQRARREYSMTDHDARETLHPRGATRPPFPVAARTTRHVERRLCRAGDTLDP